jgi:hypothetical protein
MKTKLKIIAFYTLALILGGCVVQSVHPLFTENELIFDANLIGTWVEKDPNNIWTFEKKDNNTYKLTYTSGGKSGTFTVCLGAIGADKYLNLYPEDPNLPQNDFYKSHLLYINSFAKVKFTDPDLTGQLMNPDGVKKLLEKKPKLIKHELTENSLILTASTKELQKFILKYGSDAKLKIFGEPEVLHRINLQEPNKTQ